MKATEEKLFILDLLRLNKSERMYSEESVINIIKQVLKMNQPVTAKTEQEPDKERTELMEKYGVTEDMVDDYLKNKNCKPDISTPFFGNSGARVPMVEQEKPSESAEELGDELCNYCPLEKKGVFSVPGGFMAGCEGSHCKEAFEEYASQKHLPDVKKFSDRLDQIFEQGNPTKAQIIDAFNKFSGEKHLPTDAEISDQEIYEMSVHYSEPYRGGFVAGMENYRKWMRDKLNNK